MPSELFEKIYKATLSLKFGEVASYGQVAEMAGLSKRAARVVGWALRMLPPETQVPWPRVVNRFGMITIVNPHFSPDEQRHRLENEGVKIVERDGNWFVQDWELRQVKYHPQKISVI